jgi:Rrf2 family protein
MFELSKRARFGLYVLVELARTPEEQRSTEDLAESFGISVNHLAKVMQTLSRPRWIVGARGPSGGYQFAGDARSISMADVVELFEGAPSFGGDASAPSTRASSAAEREINNVVREIEEQAYYTLKSVTIHLLAHPPRKKRRV